MSNPGKNVKGQPCRAQRHHQGKMGDTYVEDDKKRRETRCKRLVTIKKGLQTLHAKNGMQYWLRWKEDPAKETTFTFSSDPQEPEDNAQHVIEDVQPQEPQEPQEPGEHEEYPQPPVVPKQSEEQLGKKDNKECCQICKQEHIGKKQKCVWLCCEHRRSKYTYWVHALCIGFVCSEEDLKDVKYFCPVHIKKHM